jgi:hypothetical protein
MARETACIYGAARRVNIATFLRENTSTSLSISQSGSTIMCTYICRYIHKRTSPWEGLCVYHTCIIVTQNITFALIVFLPGANRSMGLNPGGYVLVSFVSAFLRTPNYLLWNILLSQLINT